MNGAAPARGHSGISKGSVRSNVQDSAGWTIRKRTFAHMHGLTPFGSVIPVEACYMGWQESLILLAKLVEPELADD